MYRHNSLMVLVISLVFLIPFPCYSQQNNVDVSSDYADLVSLYNEFREYVRPKVTNGVPDYTAAAMEEQRHGLKEFQNRLAAIEIKDWPISQQVDYHVVRAEMNGFEFEHRVRRPWARDPSFYLFSQVGNGPTVDGRPHIPDLPMSQKDAAAFKAQLQAVSGLLLQAQENLTEAAGDLARIALHYIDDEVAMYQDMAAQLSRHHPELVSDVDNAISAVKDYGKWLEANLSTMNW